MRVVALSVGTDAQLQGGISAVSVAVSVGTGILAAATLIIGGAAGLAASGDLLSGHRWRSRVLVLAAPEAGDPHLRAQREALASVHGGMRERDLVVVEAVGDGAEATGLRDKLRLPDDAFRAVLVGKDGGAKLTSAEPIPPQRLFATIDAMPMRQGEMKKHEAGRR